MFIWYNRDTLFTPYFSLFIKTKLYRLTKEHDPQKFYKNIRTIESGSEVFQSIHNQDSNRE
jgi:hypothetical protein